MENATPPPPAATAGLFGRGSSTMWKALRGIGGSAVTLIIIFVYFSVTQPSFLTTDNIDNILRSSTPLWLAAIGMTFVIIGGGLDLSMGSLAALSGVILTEALTRGAPPVVALMLTLFGCFLLGYLLNGVSIGWLGFNFFIVTLATLSIFRGAALVISDAQSTSTFDVKLIQTIGDGEVASIPVPVLIAIVCTVLAFLVLRYTRFGRMVFAVGGNEEAARISGIDVNRVRVMLYGIAGLMAGISGLILTGRLTSSQPVSGGIGLELSAAAAVLLGGTKFTGGYGGVGRTLVGVLYIGVLQSGLTIAGVQSYWQQVATGVILFLAVAFDRLQRD
jgi:ribose/xylose/arabinose/galactoside ABC-type transport system permease subunit